MGRLYTKGAVALAFCTTLSLQMGWGGVGAAAEPPKDKSSANTDRSGGGGGGGAGASGGGSSTGTENNNLTGGKSQFDPGATGSLTEKGSGKPWQVLASWETHGLLWLTNTGNASRKWFNYGYASATLNITGHDRIRLRGGLTDVAIADQGETGWRATDPSLSFSHRFDLPWELTLRLTAAATAGVGYYSWKNGIYTSPTGRIDLSRSFGGFSLELEAYGGGYIVRCSSSCLGNGSPNPRAVVGFTVTAEYEFWFHKPLVIGIDAFTSYVWYYEVGTQPEGTYYGSTSSMKTPGASGDPRFTSQPAQQQYGGEIYLRYTPPAFYGVKPELLLALSDGGSALGSNSVLIDGRPAILLNYWQSFEAYGAVTFRY